LEKLKMEKLDEHLLFLKTYKGKTIPLKEREEILEEIGSGTISPSLVFRNTTGKSPENLMFPEREKAPIKRSLVLPKRDMQRTVRQGGVYLMIGGQRDMPYRLSSCCKPKLTDNIIAYMTKGKGVSIHKMNCAFVANAASDRLLEAVLKTSEDAEHASKYQVSLLLQIRERKNYLREIVDYFNEQNITILSFATLKKEGEIVFRKVIINIFDEHQLEQIIHNLETISGMMKVSRV
jgi:GTP pyrophosphokinase